MWNISAVCVSLVLGLVLSVLPLHASIPAGITVGLLLDQLSDRVDAAISHAETAGDRLILNGANTAIIAIQHAELAYERSMNKTFDRMDGQTRTVFAQLDQIVDALERGTVQLDTITQQVQLAVNAMPLANHQPQLRATTPAHVVPGENYDAMIRFDGNFVYAAVDGYAPTLLVDGHAFAPVATATTRVAFSVPIQRLAGKSAERYSYTIAEFVVPYLHAQWMGLRRMRREARFKIIIGTLPGSPGRIAVRHRVLVPMPDERIALRDPSAGVHTQHSHSDDIPHNPQANRRIYRAAPPPAGYTVDPKSVHVETTRIEGRRKTPSSGANQWEVDLVLLQTAPTPVVGVATVKRSCPFSCGLHSGKIDFYIDYAATRPTPPREEWSERLYPLRWGESFVLPHKPGDWLVVFDSFDGRHAETKSPEDLHLIKVEVSGDSLRIAAHEPATLQWP